MKTPRNSFRMQRTAITLLSLAASGVCHAAPPKAAPPKPPDAPVDAALEARRRRDKATIAGNQVEAYEAYREAWKLKPNNRDVACNVGRIGLRLNKNREAMAFLRRCLDLPPEPGQRNDIDLRNAETLEYTTALQRTSMLTIDLAEPGARVVVDDDAVYVTPISEDIFVDPGEHHIQAFKDSRTTHTSISTKPGKSYTVALVLPKALPSPNVEFPPYILPIPTSYFRWWPIQVGGAVVGTSIIVGTLLMGSASTQRGQADGFEAQIAEKGKNCVQVPSDPLCTSYDRANGSSEAYSTAAIVSFVTAGAVTAGVITYALIENHRVNVQVGATSFKLTYKF